MDTFKITVEFTVKADGTGPWDSETCAVDFVSHRIDEGWRLDDFIKRWKLVSVRRHHKKK